MYFQYKLVYVTYVENSFRDAMGCEIVADVRNVQSVSGIMTDSKSWCFCRHMNDEVEHDEVTLETGTISLRASRSRSSWIAY